MFLLNMLTATSMFFGLVGQGSSLVNKAPDPQVLATKTYSLENRYQVPFVNDVFADNILLTYSYLSGQTQENQKVDWDMVKKPSRYQFELEPGKTFAFHDEVMDQYKDTVVKTTNARFSSKQGFKSDGHLVGDGVCHFASFINFVSTQAGLKVDAPTNHNFATIPDVEKKYGTSIFYMPGQTTTSNRQNLYVTNTTDKTIAFVFSHTNTSIEVTIESLN